jgi:hypothetical protein
MRSSRILALLAIVATALVAHPAAAEWREASSDHFLIYADSDERWLRGFADRLERMDSAMRLIRSLNTAPGARSNRLTIYVVPSESAVEKLCGQGCRNVAGFYVPRAGGSIAFTPHSTGSGGGPNDFNADIVLYHEYAHHLMLENFAAAYPRWFVEGFAEFNASAKIGSDGSVSIGRPAQHRAVGLLQQDVFYGRAWLLTHMLTFDRTRDGQLSRYLGLINQGKSSLEAARTAFGDLKQLARDMQTYLQQNKMSVLNLPPDRLHVGVIALRPLTPGEAGTMAVRMRSDRGVNSRQAAELLPEARRRAAAFPADPAAQSVLAEAEYDAGNDALCEAAADRALAADLKNRNALMYKGRARLRMAANAKATEPAVWKEARSWFVKANRQDPDAAEPLMLFYASFITAQQKPTASAVNGLHRAFELSPHDAGLRLLVVRQLLIEDKPAEARAVLLPLAYDPHARPDNLASSLVAAIDAGIRGPAIVATIEKAEKEGGASRNDAPQSSSSSYPTSASARALIWRVMHQCTSASSRPCVTHTSLGAISVSVSVSSSQSA